MNEKTALLSVYHKQGIVDFATKLVARGWNIIASGGTAKVLREANIPVRDVGDIVGEPILGHRVVTLSREVHTGILARDLPEDERELARLGLPRINMVCVDMYPLKKEIERPGATRESVIEMTDVGGPTMLHSGAKGERVVICDPRDRDLVLKWLDNGCPDKEKIIDYLNAKADGVVADYCLTAAAYRSGGRFEGVVGELMRECKYGENAWQTPAGLYLNVGNNNDQLALANFTVLAGDAPSYNNWCDIDRMLQTVTHLAAAFDDERDRKNTCIAVGVKHGNPCGASVGETPAEVINKMVSGDTLAIFGGLAMLNFTAKKEVAEAILASHMPPGQKRLLDGIVAPGFVEGAIELFQRKSGKCRIIANPGLQPIGRGSLDRSMRIRQVRGGFLRQPNYTFVMDFSDARVERFGDVSSEQKDDLRIAWAVGSTSNSNTITLVKNGQLIGNGVGQQDRVGCCKLAVERARRAGHDTNGAVAYSDSFFPFTDGPEVLADAGIKAILASSGSINDDAVKKTCAERGVSLVMIPDAVGRGFFGH